MNLRCLLGIHKWQLSKQKILLVSRTNELEVATSARFCPICCKKQVQRPVNGTWKDWPLSKDELRDAKLKKLGL